MRIYDGHIHLGGMMDPDPSFILGRMEQAGIYGGCIMSIDPEDPGFTYKERIDNLFKWVDGHEDRLFPVAWLHPYEDDIFGKVQDCAKRGVKAFKFIASNYTVGDKRPAEVFKLIEELGLPILFHSGILYDFNVSSQNNMPVNWECFLNFRSLKFSLAHCGHPWVNDAIAEFGKFRWAGGRVQHVADGGSTIYERFDWLKERLIDDNGKLKATYPELYLDTTPGPSGVFRDDLFKRLINYCPTGEKIFFGSDNYAELYDPGFIKAVLKDEQEFCEKYGASEEFKENMYEKSLMRFLGIK